MCHFLPAKSPDALSMKSCQIFSYRRWKWAFAQQKQLPALAIEAQFLIYNFATVANRHGRYHCQQPPENKLTFFFFSFFLRFSSLYPTRWAAFLKMMCRFIGADASCQSNIRGTGNWRWRWWGNPHAYISVDKKGQQASFVTSQPSPRRLRLSLEPRLHPWNPPFPFSHQQLLRFLVFRGFVPVFICCSTRRTAIERSQTRQSHCIWIVK